MHSRVGREVAASLTAYSRMDGQYKPCRWHSERLQLDLGEPYEEAFVLPALSQIIPQLEKEPTSPVRNSALGPEQSGSGAPGDAAPNSDGLKPQEVVQASCAPARPRLHVR
jgi:hypothetical protein